MRTRVRWVLGALAAVVAPALLRAQSVRGTVVDDQARPVIGAVVQLMDSLGRSAARALGSESGDFRVTAPRAGTYRLRSARIGFRPTVSAPFTLAAGETRTERVVVEGIQFALDTVRIVSSNSCRADARVGTATFEVLEQARTALQATELTGAQRGITATTLDYDRALDPGGRRVRRMEGRMRKQTVRQPWVGIAPDSLHGTGYVVRNSDGSTNYYAPGLDMLASDLFVADHCFDLKRDADQLGVAFEPIRERRQLPEIRGIIWLDVKTSQLKRLDFAYVNLPNEIDAAAGAQLEFTRLPTGGWVITRWHIRMPVLEGRIRAQAYGGNALVVRELSEQGGELVLAQRGNDTLWAQPKRKFTGVIRDSVSGSPSSARVSVVGLNVKALADDRGRFELRDLLPGDYSLEIVTPSLDSVSGRHEAIVELRGEDEVNIRVPSGAQFLASMCGDSQGRQGGVYGQLESVGRGLPGDAKVLIEWLDPRLQSTGSAVLVSRDRQSKSARPDAAGRYRVCGVPVNTDLSIRVETDSALTTPTRVRIANRFARVDIPVARIAMYGTLTGSVTMDSSGAPVSGADVAVEDVYQATTTDTNGVFRIRDIPPGAHHVVVRKLGLTAFDTTITFERNVVVTRKVSLRRTQVLSGIVTTAARLPLTFREHQRMGLGDFLTRIDLEKQEGRSLGAVLTQLRGMKVLMGGAGNHAWVATNRRPDCLKGMICPADTFFNVDRIHGQVQRCYALVYLDNVLQNRGKPTPPFDANEIKVDRIEGIEYFAGAAEVPMEYSGLNTNCGVLVVHTRKAP